jgi:hypothetical protein
MNYIISRLKEASTWRGLILILTAAGVSISPELGEAIVTVGLALAGGIGMLTPDSK